MINPKTIAILLFSIVAADHSVRAESLESAFPHAQSMVGNFRANQQQQRPPAQPIQRSTPSQRPSSPSANTAPSPLPPENAVLPPRPVSPEIQRPPPEPIVMNRIDPYGLGSQGGYYLELPQPRDPSREQGNAFNPFTDHGLLSPSASSPQSSDQSANMTPNNAFNPFANRGLPSQSTSFSKSSDESAETTPSIWVDAQPVPKTAGGQALVLSTETGQGNVVLADVNASSGEVEHYRAEIDRLDKLEVGLQGQLDMLQKESESQQENLGEILETRHEVFVDGVSDAVSVVGSLFEMKLDKEKGKISEETIKRLKIDNKIIQSSVSSAAAIDAGLNNKSDNAHKEQFDKSIDAANDISKVAVAIVHSHGALQGVGEEAEAMADFEAATIKALKHASDPAVPSEKANVRFQNQLNDIVHMVIPLLGPEMSKPINLAEHSMNTAGNGYTYYKANQSVKTIEEAASNIHNAQVLLSQHLKDCENQENFYKAQLSSHSSSPGGN